MIYEKPEFNLVLSTYSPYYKDSQNCLQNIQIFLLWQYQAVMKVIISCKRENTPSTQERTSGGSKPQSTHYTEGLLRTHQRVIIARRYCENPILVFFLYIDQDIQCIIFKLELSVFLKCGQDQFCVIWFGFVWFNFQIIVDCHFVSYDQNVIVSNYYK